MTGTDATRAAPALVAQRLTLGAGERTLVDALDLDLRAGMFTAVLGRNGSGKTLLLHTLAGLRDAQGGTVLLDGAPLASLARREIARRIALLAQDSEAGQPTAVADLVALGRYAHAPAWGGPSATDQAIAAAAMRAADVHGLAHRSTATLSGGELRRAAMALVLAQEAPLMLLDEPTNHLDPQHCMLLLEAFAGRARAGAAVMATLHDPGLAAHFASHVLLLFGDGRWRFGPAGEILSEQSLGELYATPMLELRAGARRTFMARGA